MALTKKERRKRIKMRVRKLISGNSQKPRMLVFRSNRQISVQLINDIDGKTIVAASSLCKEISENKAANKIEQAKFVGTLIAKRASDAGIAQVVFDRNGYLYHGRVKSLAEAAREGGLKF